MFAKPLKPDFNVKYVKSVTLEAFIKNEVNYSKELLTEVWNKHNPKPKEVKESK